MENKNLDIRDDEFRVIGQVDVPHRRKLLIYWLLAGVSVIVIFIVFVIGRRVKTTENAEGVFESFDVPKCEAVPPCEDAPKAPLGSWEYDEATACVEKLDTVINDVILSIYIPHNLVPRLTVGAPNVETRKALLAFQAADIRADNRRILGAFVLKGVPLAWGLSKKGYCGIIDGEVVVGVADDSPLFEKATETGGYFFRQYALVDNGVLVENEPKNKTMRKALCDRAGQIFVVVSESDESFHDFAQALVDLGVDNAIYLVGSRNAYGWYVDSDGTRTEFGADIHRNSYKNESYIVWE